LAPGLGHIDFNEVFEALKRFRYDGWLSVEILPGENPDDMARKAIGYLKPKVIEYNNRH